MTEALPRDLPRSPIADLAVVELSAGDEPLLQRFFDANPEYFLATRGEPAPSNEAHDEIHGDLPAGWPFTKKWVFGHARADGSLAAMANVVSDLPAKAVWHVGTFIVETRRHGTGDAQRLYASVEAWAKAHGARWMRLGVVEGNVRAERFWHSAGYAQARVRSGVPFGAQVRTVRILYKALAGGSFDDYLSVVPRDRPDDESA